MKKNLLIVACLYLSLAGTALAAETPNAPTNAEIKQKACQNVFSFINIDLSVMSPRATGNDMSLTESKPAEKRTNIVPITNKQKPIPGAQNRTSLLRIDLLHLFKIQIF